MPKVAPTGTKHRPSSAPPLPAVLDAHPAPPDPPAAAAAPCAPPYDRTSSRRHPSEPAVGVRHHAAAPRLREPYPVYARAPGAQTVWTAPKPSLRTGGRVELPPPPPPARGAAAPSSLAVPMGRPFGSGSWLYPAEIMSSGPRQSMTVDRE